MSGSKALQLSVKQLVEFSALRGDLSHHQSGPTHLEGIQGHLKIQKARGERWQTEVFLQHEIKLHSYAVTLQGRADLIYEDFVSCIIEEIKTTYHPAEQLPEAKKFLHLAQARVYAYLYLAENHDRHHVDVRVTWYDLLRNKTHSESESASMDDLQAFVLELVQRYLSWHSKLELHRQASRALCKSLLFPFSSFRPQQRSFSSLVYQSIRDGEDLLIEAPTGSGKTMATLFPSLKAYGEGLVQQICYFTQKNSNASVAENTLAILDVGALGLSYTRIQAKDKTCPCRQDKNSTQYLNEEGQCLRTIGYYDRLPAARLEALQKSQLNSQAIQDIATSHNICPFQLSLEMARWTTLFIGDVNYFFDPIVRLSFFDENANTRALLLDELHNLVDRGRDMFSISLDTFALKSLQKSLKRESRLLSKSLAELIASIDALAEADAIFESLPPKLTMRVENFIVEHQQSEKRKIVQDLSPVLSDESLIIIDIYKFQRIAQLYGEGHILIYEKKPSSTRLKLFCRDPAKLLADKREYVRSSIGFSATLRPIDYFTSTLGFDAASKAFSLPSTFPAAHQLTLRCDYIDTRWHRREQSLDQLVAMINSLQANKAGNYLIFLPSYAYLDALYETFTRTFPDTACLRQTREADEASRAAFIDAFVSAEQKEGNKAQNQSLIGFAILGGIFAEGIDYLGDSLRGAIVVGLGMPQPAKEQKLLEAYFQAQGKNSFQYVYQFPGLIRVLQTAGRVIRSEHDKGVVILVDPRLKQQEFSALLPDHWDVEGIDSENCLAQRLQDFWHEK